MTRRPRYRRTLVALAVLVSVLLFARTLVAPFHIPSNSMAPGLRGEHWRATCPLCGADVQVGGDASASDSRSPRRNAHAAFCSNCGTGPFPLDRLDPTPGDRVLVDRTAFRRRDPQRWELIAFDRPGDAEPCVKRAVGLPGERIELIDGDVHANGELVRKTHAEARALAVPVFAQEHRPPHGWRDRWGNDAGANAVLVLDPGQALTYRHPDALTDFDPYNGGGPDQRGRDRPNRAHDRQYPVHDFIVTTNLTPRGGPGVIAVSLNDGHDAPTLELPVGPGSRSLTAGQTYRLAVAFVDRRFSASLDGEDLLPPRDLPPAADRPEVTQPLTLRTVGVRAEFAQLRLSRDVHYTPAGRRTTCQLGPGEYFALGDNSAVSDDSRHWATPAVPAAALLGRPFYRHGAAKWSRWQAFGRTAELLVPDWPRVGRIR